MSPTLTSRLHVCHFCFINKLGKKSRVHLFQNAFMMPCTKYKRRRGFASPSYGPLGILADARPSKILFGLRYAPSSSVVGCRPIGLSLIKLATSKQTVWSSENSMMFWPIAAVIARLTDFIRASEIPFSQGASAGVNSHLSPSFTPNSSSFYISQPFVMFRSSSLADTSCGPLSE